jgi:hypothetical protein
LSTGDGCERRICPLNFAGDIDQIVLRGHARKRKRRCYVRPARAIGIVLSHA